MISRRRVDGTLPTGGRNNSGVRCVSLIHVPSDVYQHRPEYAQPELATSRLQGWNLDPKGLQSPANDGCNKAREPGRDKSSYHLHPQLPRGRLLWQLS